MPMPVSLCVSAPLRLFELPLQGSPVLVSCLEDQLRFEIVKPLFESDGIHVRVDESSNTGMQTGQLSPSMLANLWQ